jgi:arylsulfatase A-like enzyme
MVMFDSLNRHLLPPYGCDWVHAPNFRRLSERALTFDKSYVCSMPCMPARRDLHTGRPNFLHCSWGPLEPFDDSMPQILKENGVYTHLATDHYHYFEDGGATYHGRYSSWEFFRGQEGDDWKGQVADPQRPDSIGRNAGQDAKARQDWVNRAFMCSEDKQPQPQTFGAGMEFIRRNRDEDNWFLQIETFDPHEPFFTQRKYKDLYAEHYDRYRAGGGKHYDWPNYDHVRESPLEVEHLRHEYASLVSMCDAYMGGVLDLFDELNLWDDTMLIVWTDHGFLLGEHECLAKIWMPFYEEVAHTPFWVWDPRSRTAGERRSALVQPSIDLAPTLLKYFGLEPTPDMLGHDLSSVIARDEPVREAAIFGVHGSQVNVTDGRHVYMRAPNESGQPLYDYTLMPAQMRNPFPVDRLRGNIELAEPFSFTKGCRTMKIGAQRFWGKHPDVGRHLLYDLENDLHQENPLQDEDVERCLLAHLDRLMRECDAPAEQWERLGLPA